MAILKKVTGFRIAYQNKEVYESADIIKFYSKAFLLQKPEETILNSLRDKLPTMIMLDIGVGAGRTTHFFAPLAGEYIGVDYSESMIKACFERFRKYSKKISFGVADARSLKSFRDDYFDLILFSYNGIDTINHEDRLRALQEIYRVTKNGGYFCFSAHNLHFAKNLFTFQPSRNPVRLFIECRRLLLMRLFNKNKWKILRNGVEQQYLIFNDGAHGFGLETLYISPKEQIKELAQSGFTDIKIYGLCDGREIADHSKLQNRINPWLYYLCNKRN